MYNSTYSDDWTELTREEAVERAYALGVAAACGHDNHEEYESIKTAAANNYDGSLIELSFDQGRSEALQLEAAGTDSDEIWDELIESTPATPIEANNTLPEMLESSELLDRFDQLEGPPASVSKPSFLLRDQQDNE